MPNTRPRINAASSPFSFHIQPARDPTRHWDYVQQVQADHKEYQGHKIIAVFAHVAHHSARRGGHCPDCGNGDENADGKQRGNPKARLVEILPCSSIKPTMRGILARWQGLSRMLNIPHTNEAAMAIAAMPFDRMSQVVKIRSIILSRPGLRRILSI